MQFMVIRKADAETEAFVMPSVYETTSLPVLSRHSPSQASRS